ncbi:MAG: hypothetical protein IT359_20295 [Gemmatimonadaceae bacterium]|nr:hypothetical protein [Gemmatimonadaceae bacterium]
MSATVRVYVNGRGVDAPANGTPVDAVRLVDAALAEAIVAGERLVTDSRGLPLESNAPVFAGAIFRVVANRQRGSAGANGAAGEDA